MTAERQLPVFVVEDHDEALRHLYRCIGAKRLPLSGMVLLHFDSHPDLNVPQNIDANDVFDKEKLWEALSIENWIMPALYAGHFHTVVWVKCEWASDIPDGIYSFRVGEHCGTGKLRVSLPLGHFVSECAYAPEEDMKHSKEIQLHVVTWNSDGSNTDTVSARLLEIVQKPYVLDLDMDFFSTRNPLRDLYSERQLDLLMQLYSLESFAEAVSGVCDSTALHRAASAATDRRRALLDSLLRGLLEQGEGCELAAVEADCSQHNLDSFRLELLRQLVSECRRRTSAEGLPPTDWQLLHEHGCTFDSTGLPHHVSTSKLVSALMVMVARVLRRLPTPAAITAARSSEDDYCPKEQVEFIQEQLLNVLTEVYPQCVVAKTY